MTAWSWLAEPAWGTWSRLEIAWTALALLALALNSAKLWLVCGDLLAAWQLRRITRTPHARDRELAAWWVVANAVAIEVTLAAFALIGWLAGTNTPAAVAAGLALIVSELAIGAAVAFSLWARIRLGFSSRRDGR